MTTKIKIQQDVRRIAKDSKDIENDVVAYVKEKFGEEFKKAEGRSDDIRIAAEDTLFGVEDGLKEAGCETGGIIVRAADALVDVARDIGEQSLEAVRSYADSAKAAIDKALEQSKGDIENIEESTKHEMKEAHSKLYEKTHEVLDDMEMVAKAVYDYSSEKAHDFGEITEPKLKEIAEKGRTAAREVEQSTADYSKKLLHHSQEKAATWLQRLAELVKPEKSGKD